MKAPKTAIVVTTIFEPAFLDGYIDDLERNGRSGQVDLIVIVDRKTPPTVAQRCAYHRERGHSIVCPTVEEQDVWLGKFPGLRERIPYNSDNRRNIGYLLALHRGAEVLISIDDDNYCISGGDFVGAHAVSGSDCTAPEAISNDGWYNVATMLRGHPAFEIYPRGFPYAARNKPRKVTMGPPVTRRVAMNAGLWLGDPDVDAITRLGIAPRIDSANAQSVLLGPGTWSPINTQNTSLSREAVAAYYYPRMGYSVGGMTIDRYGDILSGYFAQKCAQSLGHSIRVGSPVANHRRTPHNLFKDLYHELAGMVIIEDLLPWLRELRISESGYANAYQALAQALEERASGFSGFVWDNGAREFLVLTAGNMRAWLAAIRSIG